jgi:hypothetical protein
MFLGTIKYDDIPSSNGSSHGAAGQHKSAPGFVARANSDADLRATAERVLDLQERIAHFKTACADAETQTDAVEKHRDGIPQYRRGWPLLIVAALGLMTVGLEYVPAWMFTQVLAKDDTTLWRLLTAIFTVIPAVLAVAVGELVHRMREPAPPKRIESTLLVVTGLATLMFLAIGYIIRFTYTSAAGHHTLGNIDPSVEAIALTSVAAIGIVVTVVSSYYRESVEMFKVRSALGKYRHELETSEGHLKSNERDLDRALTALYGPIPTRDQLTDRAEAQRRADAARLEADEKKQTAAAVQQHAEAEQMLAAAQAQRVEAVKQRGIAEKDLADAERVRAEAERQRKAAPDNPEKH